MPAHLDNEIWQRNLNVPLSLDPGSRKAFADRQAKLVADDSFPMTKWYNDDDFCRAYNTACQLADKLTVVNDKLVAEELRAQDLYSRNCDLKEIVDFERYKCAEKLKACHKTCQTCHAIIDVRDEGYRCYFCKTWLCSNCAVDHFTGFHNSGEEKL